MATALDAYSWDSLAPYAELARAHPEGIVDLAIGNPVDPVPDVVQRAIAAGANAHSYPQLEGTPVLREEIVAWYARRRGVPGLGTANVLPTIGSKELIALLPLLVGIGAGDAVVHPRAAYPTYAVGARLAGAEPVASDDPAEWPENTRLAWINSPGNPDGRVLGVDALRAAVARARELGAILALDECYAELGWEGEWASGRIPSILDPAVCDGDVTGLVSVYSLSKQSNLAGYRAAFLAGDAGIVARIREPRLHIGLWPPTPVQAAMVAALRDDAHVAAQKELYRARRIRLAEAVAAAGFRIEGSEAGLFLWTTEDRDAWESVDRLARLGVLAVPGHFYGTHTPHHVRFSLTAPDALIARAAERLSPRR
ncbi:succinyldiaminopimelate transaminase [Protaetiibacter intestinalis]|uniref:Aminotransferase n=1 Tax=Protaetiibacter intestinalis TaxID=2419774 RepID=A0A387B2V2_9MICO|nr:succinyldiaminopimelate transaminase [Protaetiibacter intestinalis]AYF97862.1 succinyldiaminopimelate transaminase [Protaetiibacter intestinalis]